MPATIAPPEYEPQAHVRKADELGRIRFRKRVIRCSKALAGKTVALRATPTDGVFDICYRRHVLTQVDLRQNISQPVHNVSEQVSTLSPV